MAEALKAYEVAVDGMAGVCFGKTRSAAKWLAVAAWRDAGYGEDGHWPKLVAKRAPTLDRFPEAHKRRAWTFEYVRAAVERGGGA